MRTTIELANERRARLLELAAQRGEKGFSALVREAIEVYLRSLEERVSRQRRALALEGTLRAAEAKALRERTNTLRREWRS